MIILVLDGSARNYPGMMPLIRQERHGHAPSQIMGPMSTLFDRARWTSNLKCWSHGTVIRGAKWTLIVKQRLEMELEFRHLSL